MTTQTTIQAVIPAAIRAVRARVSTDQDVRDLPTENKRYKVFTTLVPNLFVFVYPSGVKSFAFIYQDLAGANQTHTLGKFGKLTLAQAVAAYETAAGMAARGECPRTAQLTARKRTATTLADEFADWFPNYSATVSRAYAARTLSVFNSTRMAALRNRRLVALEMPDVLEFAKAAEVAQSKGYAREVVHLIDKLYAHARSQRRFKGDNPAHGVVDMLARRDSQPWEALQLEHLPTYFADLDALDAKAQASAWRVQRPASQVKPTTVLALRILPRITVRPSVLRVAQWSWVQWDSAQGPMLVVPAFEQGTKQRVTEQRADRKGKAYAPYLVPLSTQVVSLLRQLQAITGEGKYLFPGYKGRSTDAEKPVSEGRWLQALRRMGWDGSTEARPAITVHGFRALFATSAYSRYVITRVEEHALEFQQDHKLTEGVRANYTRDKHGSHRGLLIGQRAALLQWWADEVDTILGRQGQGLHQSRADMAAAFVTRSREYNSPALIS